VSGLKRGDQDWECEHPSNFYGVHEAHGHFKIFARIGQITYHDADLTATFVCLGSFASVWPRTDDFRGRDASYLAPPAQIRTGPIRAYGSHLGCLTAKRLAGHG